MYKLGLPLSFALSSAHALADTHLSLHTQGPAVEAEEGVDEEGAGIFAQGTEVGATHRVAVDRFVRERGSSADELSLQRAEVDVPWTQIGVGAMGLSLLGGAGLGWYLIRREKDNMEGFIRTAQYAEAARIATIYSDYTQHFMACIQGPLAQMMTELRGARVGQPKLVAEAEWLKIALGMVRDVTHDRAIQGQAQTHSDLLTAALTEYYLNRRDFIAAVAQAENLPERNRWFCLTFAQRHLSRGNYDFAITLAYQLQDRREQPVILAEAMEGLVACFALEGEDHIPARLRDAIVAARAENRDGEFILSFLRFDGEDAVAERRYVCERLGELLFYAGRYEAAIRVLAVGRDGVHLRPDLVARCYTRLGQFPEAFAGVMEIQDPKEQYSALYAITYAYFFPEGHAPLPAADPDTVDGNWPKDLRELYGRLRAAYALWPAQFTDGDKLCNLTKMPGPIALIAARLQLEVVEGQRLTEVRDFPPDDPDFIVRDFYTGRAIGLFDDHPVKYAVVAIKMGDDLTTDVRFHLDGKQVHARLLRPNWKAREGVFADGEYLIVAGSWYLDFSRGELVLRAGSTGFPATADALKEADPDDPIPHGVGGEHPGAHKIGLAVGLNAAKPIVEANFGGLVRVRVQN